MSLKLTVAAVLAAACLLAGEEPAPRITELQRSRLENVGLKKEIVELQARLAALEESVLHAEICGAAGLKECALNAQGEIVPKPQPTK